MLVTPDLTLHTLYHLDRYTEWLINDIRIILGMLLSWCISLPIELKIVLFIRILDFRLPDTSRSVVHETEGDPVLVHFRNCGSIFPSLLFLGVFRKFFLFQFF